MFMKDTCNISYFNRIIVRMRFYFIKLLISGRTIKTSKFLVIMSNFDKIQILKNTHR